VLTDVCGATLENRSGFHQATVGANYRFVDEAAVIKVGRQIYHGPVDGTGTESARDTGDLIELGHGGPDAAPGF